MMNKDAYAHLPAKAKQAIDENSGYTTSKDDFGAALDRIYANAQTAVRSLPGHTITCLTPREIEGNQRGVVIPLIEEWQKKIPNGSRILAAYRDEAARVQAER